LNYPDPLPAKSLERTDNPKFMSMPHQTPRLGAGRREAEGIGGNPPVERLIDTPHDAVGTLAQDVF
jgi:hypothetical protein